MLNGIGNIAYLGAATLFILSLRGLSHPSTARLGNLYGVAGMLIAVVATLLIAQGAGLAVVLVAAVVGAAGGAPLAPRGAVAPMAQPVPIPPRLVRFAAAS